MPQASRRPDLKSEKGVALLITLFAMTLLTFIALEVSYDTSVDYVVASQQVNRIRAYYAAKSGVEISLLRIMLYKQVVGALGSNSPVPKEMLDPIWSFPFMWPPSLEGAKTTETEKNMVTDAVNDSYMGNSQYATTISAEGGRIDVNDLGSPVKALQKAMIQQVLNIFKAELEHNEEFNEKHRGENFQELVNNIADYIDEDKESLNGGDESSPYRDIAEPGVEMPPNRSLRTVDELHQVAGMTDEFYNMIAPRLTVYGSKGVNINYASRDILLALDPSMTAEAVDKVIARRSDPKQGGPFKSEQEFFSFVTPFSVNVKAIQESKIPLLFDQEFNFRIQSTGISSNVKREITVITFDFPNLAARYADMIQKQRDLDQGITGNSGGSGGGGGGAGGAGGAAGGTGTDTGGANQIKAAKGRPTIVSWEEN